MNHGSFDAALLLLTTAGAASAQSWPPTPDPGDLPYGDATHPYGLLYKNGRAYKIEYVTTMDTISETDNAAPCDWDLSATGFSTNALVNSFNVCQYALGGTYLNGGLLYRVWLDKKMPWDTGPIVSTDGGKPSHTLRSLLCSLTYAYGSGTADGFTQPNPFYKFKVTALDPVSSYFDLHIEVAQGGYAYCSGNLQTLMPGYPNSRSVIATASGRFSASVAISSPGSPGAYQTSGSTTKAQGASLFVDVPISNGVGYFYVNTPVHIGGTMTGMSADSMSTISCWEVVPFRIYSGP